MDPKSAFSILQPLCVEVAKQSNISSLLALKKALEVLIDNENTADSNKTYSFIHGLKEYLCFPLLLTFQKNENW